MGGATILFVEDDDDARQGLRRMLIRDGYRVLMAIDEEDALERISYGLRPKVILLNQDGSTDDVLAIGVRIRAIGNLGGVPIVVIASKFEASQEGENMSVGGNDYICYWEGHDQLKDLLTYVTSEMAGGA